MKYISNKLGRQLLLMIVIIFDIVLLTLGVLLPRFLAPIYEDNIYVSLKNPLEILPNDFDDSLLATEVAYIRVNQDGSIISTKNLNDIIPIEVSKLIDNVVGRYGKFKYKDKLYYYYSIEKDSVTKIAITNNSYTNKIKYGTMDTVLPVVLVAFLLIALIVFIWSSMVVRKISKLKLKIDNIDNDNFNHKLDFKSDDEINTLARAVEDMRISLKNQEKYKNQLYQNISHDFKTPLTVVKSYIEAANDGTVNYEKAFKVISEQTDKLEKKVHSLLYLNKLDYLKDIKTDTNKLVDIKKIIELSIDKFKYQRSDVVFETDVDNSKFYGTDDLWETIIDNILSNFMRYVEHTVRITVKSNKIILYNDGSNIDDEIIDTIFNPFKKGIKGEFGLGLSIVKKTLNLLNYDISIRNQKKGVSFIITKCLNI